MNKILNTIFKQNDSPPWFLPASPFQFKPIKKAAFLHNVNTTTFTFINT